MSDDNTYSGEGTTAVGMKVHRGHVVFNFPHPVAWLKMEPVQALELAGALVRAGMEAKTGRTPTDIAISRLMGETQKQITREQRTVLINRVILMMKSMSDQKRPPLYQAEAIIDRILTDTK